MSLGFTASEFSATSEEWGWITRLGAPSTDDEDFYLVLQRKHSFSEQDTRFGHNQAYIEYCGQGWSWYGHMESVDLFRDRLVVEMDEQAAARMRSDGVIEVRFNLDDRKFRQLEEALRRTFDGFTYFRSQEV